MRWADNVHDEQDLRKHHRESPPNPPTLGGVNLVPPRFGGLGGLLRKS